MRSRWLGYTPNADDVYIGVDTGNDDEIYHKDPILTTKYCEITKGTGGTLEIRVRDGSHCKDVDGLRWNDKGHACQYKDPDDSTWKSLPWTSPPPE